MDAGAGVPDSPVLYCPGTVVAEHHVGFSAGRFRHTPRVLYVATGCRAGVGFAVPLRAIERIVCRGLADTEDKLAYSRTYPVAVQGGISCRAGRGRTPVVRRLP